MPSYKAPLQDMQFLLDKVFDLPTHLKNFDAFSEFTPELTQTVLEEGAKITETLVQPLNQIGDQQGCKFNNGKVTTPPGFVDAYKTLAEAGWTGLTSDPEFGGQGLPHVIGLLYEEMLCSSNTSFSLYPGLTAAVCRAIGKYGDDKTKEAYLPNMIAGKWAGVMCLTEPHCGTDLSLVRTKALPNGNNTYTITGTKIFITGGEHDLTENIIHLVLARTPDAPEGIKGISLFLVPKISIHADGSLGESNQISCGSIEHKMGIKGACTCVMNYNGAKGILIGELNKGMSAMFTVMNIERIAIGLQGLALAEVAYQNARNYAQDRLQGRSPTGAKCPEKNADPIIVHPDVRRMLLTIKSQNEAARALTVWIAKYIDMEHYAQNENDKQHANKIVALFTPILKAYFTDYGFDACNLALQVLGGHGYISEWGLEQFVRDARIAQIYEGANGIQALDLIGRKLIHNQGEYLNLFLTECREHIEQHQHEFTASFSDALNKLESISHWILDNANKDAYLAGSSSYDYLHLFSLTAFAFMWHQMIAVAKTQTNDFNQAKIRTGDYFFKRVLPRIHSLAENIQSGSDNIMQMADELF